MATVAGSLRNKVLVLDDVTTGDLTVTGSVTISGTATTINSTNTSINDHLIELNAGLTGANANDTGLILERGSTGNNVFIGWDESTDKVMVATTTADGTSTGNLSLTAANFQAADVTMSSATSSGKITINATEGLEVGGIRGRAIGNQSGDFIQLYERVHIGYHNGWGATEANAPAQGLSTWGSVNVGTGGSGVLQIDDTTVIDTSRNLTNIGTISSSHVNSSGRGTFVGNAATPAGNNALNLLSSSNGAGVAITFTDNGTPPAATLVKEVLCNTIMAIANLMGLEMLLYLIVQKHHLLY